MRRSLARLLGAGAAMASLGACATITAPGMTPLDHAGAAYSHLQAAADRALPLLPADKARRVRVILALIGAGLDVARAASGPVDRTAAIASVEAQLVALHTALRD
ncbi:hypothetical protein [uncultured Sphingomonas sp.]|uniref:hypothetical protein n=1 Tax=uncultured Sphingomonas sp. TaxID=158754 RepID=UPI0026330856|nr:hypothetical protein [uncultured Sphingomonas sp.]